LSFFKEIFVVDFEFTAKPGERPVPICLARKIHGERRM